MAEERKYYLRDIETDTPYEVSKKVYDEFHRMWNSIRSSLNTPIVGKIIVYGIGGDLDNNKQDFKDIFYNSEHFKTK